MKVSVSGLPSTLPNSQIRNSQGPFWEFLWRPATAIAVIYLAAHVPFLAPSLEDYDSINFALGLRDFDPSRHQPHPPGSPVYIAAGRVAWFILGSWLPLGRAAAEAVTLALLSAVGGAISLLALARIFALLASPSSKAAVVWGTAITAVCPLFWLFGLRPMSDLPGLAAAVVAQGFLIRGRTHVASLVAGALLAGLAAGIRVQALWLTVPLLLFVLLEQWRAGAIRPVLQSVAGLVAGAFAWAVPLVADSGGLDAYLRALRSQAGEDFAFVNMLWLEPTPRRAAFAMYETFVQPWGSTLLAAVVGAAAIAGLCVMLLRERRELALLLAAFGPYVVLHLLFQETFTVRYALPAVPLVAWLAARGIAATGRLAPFAGLAIAGWALVMAVPVAVAYGGSPHPAFQAIADASTQARTTAPAAVYSHYSVYRALQADPGGLSVVEPRRFYEWLGPAAYWQEGGANPIWFIADARRTDLALIDPAARLDVVKYRWPVAGRPELSGTRPLAVDWYRIAPPGWFATEGWSLTPETGGLARATATRPDSRPITAWVRRRTEPVHLVVAGRHLGVPGDPPAEFELTLDGVVQDRWTATVDTRNFLRFIDIPGGTGAGSGYVPLTISSRAPGGAERRAAVGVEQFDIQPASRLIYAFAEGWHEEEYDPINGRRWRWTSERSVLRVKGGVGPVAIACSGESPLRYFDAPPDVRIMAGPRVVARFQPDADFEWRVTIPEADLSNAEGAIAIETDRVYMPGAAEGSADARHLGLRLYECRVSSVSD